MKRCPKRPVENGARNALGLVNASPVAEPTGLLRIAHENGSYRDLFRGVRARRAG